MRTFIRFRNRPGSNSRRNNCTTSASIIISEPAPPDNPEVIYPSMSPSILRMIRPFLLSRERRNTILGNICSNDKPGPIKSSGHKITIVYNSGALINNPILPRPRGFKLNFSSEAGGTVDSTMFIRKALLLVSLHNNPREKRLERL